MHSLVKRYWWLLIAWTLMVSLACDYHRVLVAEQGGGHTDN